MVGTPKSKRIKKPGYWPRNPYVHGETLKDKIPMLGMMTGMFRPLFVKLIDERDQQILVVLREQGKL